MQLRRDALEKSWSVNSGLRCHVFFEGERLGGERRWCAGVFVVLGAGSDDEALENCRFSRASESDLRTLQKKHQFLNKTTYIEDNIEYQMCFRPTGSIQVKIFTPISQPRSRPRLRQATYSIFRATRPMCPRLPQQLQSTLQSLSLPQSWASRLSSKLQPSPLPLPSHSRSHSP